MEQIENTVLGLRDLREGPSRLARVVALGNDAVPSLERLLRGPSESIDQPRSLAADALGLIGTLAAIDALRRALADCTTRQLAPVPEYVELVVIDHIAEDLGDARAAIAVPDLIAALERSPYPGCVNALAKLRDPAAVPVLVARLFADVTREASVDALRAFDPVTVRQHVANAITNRPRAGDVERADQAWGRAAAVRLLSELRGSVNVVRAALEDPAKDVREAAALVLADSPEHGNRVLHILVDALASEDWQRAEEATIALTRRGPEAVQLLHDAARAPDDLLSQRRAVDTLGRLGWSISGPALESLAREGNANVRRAVVRAVERFPAAEVTTLLVRLTYDPEKTVRSAAADAIAARERATGARHTWKHRWASLAMTVLHRLVRPLR